MIAHIETALGREVEIEYSIEVDGDVCGEFEVVGEATIIRSATSKRDLPWEWIENIRVGRRTLREVLEDDYRDYMANGDPRIP